VVDRALDLAAMPHDACVFEQTRDVARGEARDAVHVEVGERAPEVVALAEDREPAQSALEPLQRDLLEEPSIVTDRPAPLGVVIGDVIAIGPAPAAPDAAVGPEPQAVGKALRRHRSSSYFTTIVAPPVFDDAALKASTSVLSTPVARSTRSSVCGRRSV